MFTKRSMVFLLFLMFTASFWSCKSPSSPENKGSEFGEVYVYSSPWHADIYLDGSYTGQRTHALLYVAVGTHKIKILKEGYKEWETTITVTAKNVGDYAKEVDAILAPLRITITNPTAGTIWIKGKEVEITWEIQTTSTSTKNHENDLNPLYSSKNILSPSIMRNIVSSTSEKRSSPKSLKIESDSNNIRPLYLPHVKIYLYKGGSELLTIVTELVNTGSYTWTVDPSLEDGTDYKIRLNVWPEKPNIQYVYWMSDEFTIKE